MNVLVAGGAGFIGSHIADTFVNHGHRVVILDGLMPETGGSFANIPHHQSLQFHHHRVEECPNLGELLDNADLTIDCMGWTRHLLAIRNPLYDLELNVASHLSLVKAMSGSRCRNLIYLGSRGQYGNVTVPVITEDQPQLPADVQGIHKTAAESHMRIFSKLAQLNVVSLRFSNSYGERQPMTGGDIGLFGSFLRDILNGRPIELYGRGRMRNFLYAPDLANVIHSLATRGWSGFEAFNIPGSYVEIEYLIATMIRAAGKGRYTIKDFPEEIRAIDVGNASLSGEKLAGHIGNHVITDLQTSVDHVVRSIAHPLPRP